MKFIFCKNGKGTIQYSLTEKSSFEYFRTNHFIIFYDDDYEIQFFYVADNTLIYDFYIRESSDLLNELLIHERLVKSKLPTKREDNIDPTQEEIDRAKTKYEKKERLKDLIPSFIITFLIFVISALFMLAHYSETSRSSSGSLGLSYIFFIIAIIYGIYSIVYKFILIMFKPHVNGK